MGAIEQTLQVKASPKQVFQAFVDPAQVTKWWAAKAEVDPQRGGVYRLTFPATSGMGPLECRFTEVTPDRKLGFTFPTPAGETEVIVFITNKGGESQVRVRQDGFGVGSAWAETQQRCAEAWKGYLGKLEATLSGK